LFGSYYYPRFHEDQTYTGVGPFGKEDNYKKVLGILPPPKGLFLGKSKGLSLGKTQGLLLGGKVGGWF
jgi:hypothetical protein